LDRLIRRTTSAFKARTEEHDRQLVVMNVELQLAAKADAQGMDALSVAERSRLNALWQSWKVCSMRR
jgi:hypothetical protein